MRLHREKSWEYMEEVFFFLLFLLFCSFLFFIEDCFFSYRRLFLLKCDLNTTDRSFWINLFKIYLIRHFFRCFKTTWLSLFVCMFFFFVFCCCFIFFICLFWFCLWILFFCFVLFFFNLFFILILIFILVLLFFAIRLSFQDNWGFFSVSVPPVIYLIVYFVYWIPKFYYFSRSLGYSNIS